MRRQAGADTVDLDTEKSYAAITLSPPTKVNLLNLQKAAHAAAYTIKRLEIELSGEIVSAPCAICKKDALFIKVAPTGELLEIRGNVNVGQKGSLQASAEKWGTEILGILRPEKHVVFKVEEFKR